MNSAIPSHTQTPRPSLDGPKTPIWLQTIQGIVAPIPYLEKARSQYGDIFLERYLGLPPFVVISDPEAIHHIFTTDPSLFDTSSGNAFLQPLLGGNKSLIHLDGVPHQQRRKLLMPHFHGERMRAYGKTIAEIATQVARQWSHKRPFSMRKATQEITLRVILSTIFGLDGSHRFLELRMLLGELLHTFDTSLGSSHLFFRALQKDFGFWSAWGRFLRRRQQIDDLLFAEIRERRGQPPGEDILSLMIAARDDQGQPMTEEELREELMGLLIVGHETTASALAWAFYWIHHQPEVLSKLLAELSYITPDTDPSDIAKLPYLSAVCSETLRIYPVVLFTFSRILKEPMHLMGYDLEPGMILAPCIYLVHHHQHLYPQPKKFRPERFLERQFLPYEYFPFGGNNRRCLGYAFALFEMKLVLATVLRQVSLKLVSNRPIQPVRRGVTFTPAGGVPMIVAQRY